MAYANTSAGTCTVGNTSNLQSIQYFWDLDKKISIHIAKQGFTFRCFKDYTTITTQVTC